MNQENKTWDYEYKPLEDKVWCSVQYTVNLGNYENVKIDMGTSCTIGDDDPSELRISICNDLLKEVINKGEDVRKKPEDLWKPKMTKSVERRKRFQQGDI